MIQQFIAISDGSCRFPLDFDQPASFLMVTKHFEKMFLNEIASARHNPMQPVETFSVVQHLVPSNEPFPALNRENCHESSMNFTSICILAIATHV